MSIPARLSPTAPPSQHLEWTSQRDEPVDPTAEMAAALTQAYGFYNVHLFSERLPACLITLQRRKGTYGYFAADRFARTFQSALDASGMGIADRVGAEAHITDEIAINPEHFGDRSVEDTLSTLVHEMVHLAQHHFGAPGRGRYHNRQWAEWMKRIGLYPSSTGLHGGAETGDTMSHYIGEDGPFAQATTSLLATGFTIPWVDASKARAGAGGDGDGDGAGGSGSKSGKRVRYTCPICLLNAWAKADVDLRCGEHEIEMEAQGKKESP